MRVEYSSNNSGGSWWLTDEDWKALEASGWEVEWVANKKGRGSLGGPDSNGRWLGALATRASRVGLSLRAAVREWERVTGKSSTDAGCACCGQPHDFYEYDDDGKMTAIGPTAEHVVRWEDDA